MQRTSLCEKIVLRSITGQYINHNRMSKTVVTVKLQNLLQNTPIPSSYLFRDNLISRLRTSPLHSPTCCATPFFIKNWNIGRCSLLNTVRNHARIQTPPPFSGHPVLQTRRVLILCHQKKKTFGFMPWKEPRGSQKNLAQ